MKSKIAEISELSKQMEKKEHVSAVLIRLYDRFCLGHSVSRLSLDKQKGVPVSELVLMLLLFRINGESIYRWYKNSFYNLFSSGKNCFYRLLNRSQMDWRKLLYAAVKSYNRIIEKESDPQQENGLPQCFILDDTLIEKTGSFIEKVSRVYDHVTGKFVMGYKLLALAYFDGKMTTGCDLSLHREKGSKGNYGLKSEELSRQSGKKRSKNNPDYIRALETDSSKIDVSLQMLVRAWRQGVKASYVLMDSWFTCTGLISEIRKIGHGAMHVLGAMKKGTTKYNYNGKMLSAKEIIVRKERKKHYSRKYKSSYFHVDVIMGDQTVRLFFIRYGRNKDWHILLTTDKKLNFLKTFELYQIRWSIEVFNKECKQYFGLGGCQSKDFNAQIADCTLCFITHMIVSIDKRFSDYETMGELFRQMQKQLDLLTLWQRILPMIAAIIELFAEIAEVDPNETLKKMLNNKIYEKKIEGILMGFMQYKQNQKVTE